MAFQSWRRVLGVLALILVTSLLAACDPLPSPENRDEIEVELVLARDGIVMVTLNVSPELTNREATELGESLVDFVIPGASPSEIRLNPDGQEAEGTIVDFYLYDAYELKQHSPVEIDFSTLLNRLDELGLKTSYLSVGTEIAECTATWEPAPEDPTMGSECWASWNPSTLGTNSEGAPIAPRGVATIETPRPVMEILSVIAFAIGVLLFALGIIGIALRRISMARDSAVLAALAMAGIVYANISLELDFVLAFTANEIGPSWLPPVMDYFVLACVVVGIMAGTLALLTYAASKKTSPRQEHAPRKPKDTDEPIAHIETPPKSKSDAPAETTASEEEEEHPPEPSRQAPHPDPPVTAPQATRSSRPLRSSQKEERQRYGPNKSPWQR